MDDGRLAGILGGSAFALLGFGGLGVAVCLGRFGVDGFGSGAGRWQVRAVSPQWERIAQVTLDEARGVIYVVYGR